jgi:hypothetical protein
MFLGPMPYTDPSQQYAVLASLLQSITYGPSGVEYTPTAFTALTLPPAPPALQSNTQRIAVTLAKGYGPSSGAVSTTPRAVPDAPASATQASAA